MTGFITRRAHTCGCTTKELIIRVYPEERSYENGRWIEVAQDSVECKQKMKEHTKKAQRESRGITLLFL
jgi:hypothetical protein